MAHIVKCKYCNIQFDTEKEPWVSVSARRYAHQKCYDKDQASKTQAERDYEELERYIKDLFGIQVLNATITKQIKTFKEDFELSYTGILSTLKWWIEIKKEKMEDAKYGIAIVPYIYDEAREYYYSKYLADQANQAVDLEHYTPKVEVVVIPPPRVYNPPPKLINLN